jgi:hypothetical protein
MEKYPLIRKSIKDSCNKLRSSHQPNMSRLKNQPLKKLSLMQDSNKLLRSSSLSQKSLNRNLLSTGLMLLNLSCRIGLYNGISHKNNLKGMWRVEQKS